MGKKFLLNTITYWNEPPRARHQVAYALSKHHQVVFVAASRLGLPGLKIQEVQKNLLVINPVFPVPYKFRYRIGVINRIYQRWLFRKLRKSYPDYILLNFDFTASLARKYFNKMVYYCNDDHIAMSYNKNPAWIARYQESCERSLIKHAALCVGTSSFLVDRMKGINQNSVEIRLGAPDLADYTIQPYKIVQNSEKIKVGIVGYVRTIDPRLLDFLLSKDDLFIILVGPVSDEERLKYKDVKNIKLTGSKIGNDLYQAVNRFDVGLIPYKLNGIIDRTPNKLWLYLALGIPVVISNIKGIREWKFPEQFVYRSNSYQEFHELIRQAVSEDKQELRKKRSEFAKQNSWDERIKILIKELEDLTTY
jgi:glycosyltransferase involved in cell wall biosynthesis